MQLTYWLKERHPIKPTMYFATVVSVFQAALVLVLVLLALNCSQVAFAVQQLVFMAAASAPAATPAFEGSLNVPTAQVPAWPPHFVASFMQHFEASVAAQVAVAQFVVAAGVIDFIPAAQVYVEHLACALQQVVFMAAASVPAAVPAFEGSLNVPAAQM